MKRICKILAVGLAFGVGLPPASAASIVDVLGNALIKTPDGVVAAHIGHQLSVGHQIIVAADSLATIDVEGCMIHLSTAMQYSVPATAPCAHGASLYVGDLSIRPTNAGIVGGSSVAGQSLVPLGIAVGAFGLVGAAVALKGFDQEEPISVTGAPPPPPPAP
jgi:hypothetical protein